MKRMSFNQHILFVLLMMSVHAHAQTGIDSTITKATQFELVNDTLTSPSGLKIYPGQKFMIGNAAGQDGRYRSIISKYAALVPNIWGRNNGYEYLIDNYVDNKKGKQQIATLAPGQVFTLGKILKAGKKQFEFYLTTLNAEANMYRCDIILALELKELSFQ